MASTRNAGVRLAWDPAATPLATRFDAVAAYTILRLGLGISMLIHGLARFIAGIDSYALPTIAGFAKVALPHGGVVFTVYAIPYVEACVGTLVFFGLFTRVGLLGTAGLVFVLMFGSGMKQTWSALAVQLPYTVIIFLLLLTIGLNACSVDRLLSRRSSGGSIE